MSELQIADELLVPGQTISFDFEIVAMNQTQLELAISSIKRSIADDDRLDYQGSSVITVGDVELQRDVQMLRINATVRKTRRANREPITTVSLSPIEAYIKASVIVYNEYLAYVKATVSKVGEVAAALAETSTQALPTLSVAALLIIAMVAYAFFFGIPKHRN